MSIVIRQIREEDIDSFYETFSVVVRERRFLGFFEPPPPAQTQAFCLNNIAKGYPQLVAKSDERVVGWCDITSPGREVLSHVGILGIAVHPDWRGQGIGERLMLQALEAADAFGFERLELGVLQHNRPAQSLYRKLGFVVEGVRRRRLRIGDVYHDEIIMARLKA